MTLIASHRGGSLERVENSPSAFLHTTFLPVDQVEFDIHPTADGAIVVHHDATLDRTTNGTGPVVAHTLDELKALILRHTEDEAMLTLGELCEVFKPTAITLRMEIKTDVTHTPYPGLLEQALAVLDAHEMRARTVITSFHPDVVAETKTAAGLQDVIWLVSPERQAALGTKGILDTAHTLGVDRVGLHSAHLNASILAALRAGGLGVGAWAVNDPITASDVLALGVDVFTTDIPTTTLRLRDGVQPFVGRTAVTALTEVPEAARDGFLALPNTNADHAEAHAGVSAFREVELGGTVARPQEGATIRLGAWNVERCLYPEESADLLQRANLDVVLLTEMDHGCHRTGNRHTTGELAWMLGLEYAYALEFLELATMPQPIMLSDTSPGNRLGFHGNGLLSRLPIQDPIVIRLDAVADWYVAPKGGQKRVGSRMAVAARVSLGGHTIVLCSVHLESATDVPGRALQFRTLLNALDAYAEGRPVVIGGDLNTPVHGPDEALFEMAVARGYDWKSCNAPGPTTRPSIWSTGAADFTLDWLCTRGLVAEAPAIAPALSLDGKVLSDHDLITVTLRIA